MRKKLAVVASGLFALAGLIALGLPALLQLGPDLTRREALLLR